MHDVWREKNPNEKQFTWRDKAFKVNVLTTVLLSYLFS